jgi:hypothetical protein
MTYWTDLFTPETYEAFSRSNRNISGFRESQKGMAEKVRVRDKFLCYMERMSRWIGARVEDHESSHILSAFNVAQATKNDAEQEP